MPLNYRSTKFQIVMLGFVLFATAGIFNALNGMGGGGQVDLSVAAKANTALHATFAIFGVTAGAVHNLLGPKILMFLGALTYILYVGSYLAFNHIHSTVFSVVAGGILGIGAAWLWTAQGVLMMSYPSSQQKGEYIAIFWVIFNLGGVLGGLVQFALNFNSTSGSVNDATYITFMVIMFCGAILALLMANPKNIVRDDGTPVVIARSRGVLEEVLNVFRAFMDWRILCLIPMFVASDFFFSYQFNAVNGFLFDVRTRGLNNVFYWGAQMVGAYVLGCVLDIRGYPRATRAVWSLVGMVIFFSAVWGGGVALQVQYDRNEANHTQKWNLDFEDSARASGPIVIYVLYGLMDAGLQSWCYWTIAALTNDSSLLARFAGLYKGVQAAGAAISWAIDANKVSYMVQLLVNWGLLIVAAPPALIVARQLEDSLST